MKISLLYTSRRPSEVGKTVSRWLHTARNPAHIEFVFTADADDRMTAIAMQHAVEFLHNGGFEAVGPFPSETPGTCVKGWNLAAQESAGDVLIAIADDFSAPEGWDFELMKAAEPDWWTKDAAVLVGDGINRDCLCMTLAILTRARYERIGYVFHPAYGSMYCDNDLAEHAAQDGVLIGATHLCFPHAHYTNGKRPQDAIDRKHSSPERFHEGRRVFEARRALHFPVDSGPRASVEARVSRFEPVAYILTLGEDFSIAGAVTRLHAEGVRNFFFSIPDETWDGKGLTAKITRERINVHAIIKTLAGFPHVRVWVQMLAVQKYRKGAELYADVEGRARNAALAEITALGFRDVLIVDDDEIWPSGLLDEVARIVETERPAYIHADGLPIVAGLPVDGAKDRVGIYMDADRNRFLSGRSPYRGGLVIAGKPVYHFTATRRDKAELLAKLRTSAHYNDPDYNFEGWIANRLPTLRPGSVNVHMYVKGVNVWPRLRKWSAREIEDIPEPLRPYLWRA